ncbi:hypothetical protein COLO4_32629 [Corchorus olitorius]|uniref:Uncharacterized protein n=1 Tax=Corchorus olitorius TaxID=93759 RepID=A0A1R3GYQ0_9ROSI|nr:hypothetical protein COLO4_32629 [Corchorus olitorius]
MKAGMVGVMHRTPCATSLPVRRGRARVTCSSSSGHVSFIKDVAATQPPENLHHLLKMLQTKGETIRSPGSRHGLIPLAIPLSENLSGAVTALLRWPTAPSGMEMPVVEVRKHGVWLLANNVDQYIHRILVEEDANKPDGSNGELFHASSEAGEKLYTRGDFAESQLPNLEAYLLKKVGLFPDLLERKVMRHFEEGDQDVADIAHWEDEQIEYIKEKVTEEGRREDLKKGKAPAQVALDEAAFLLDLASIEGAWNDYLDRVAECYKEAGYNEIANFILYKD